MKKRNKTTAVLLVLVVAICGTVLAKSVYVSIKTARLRSGTSAFDKDVAKVKLGDKLSVKGTSERWIKVKTSDNKEGWIYDRQVSEKKPKDMDAFASKKGKVKFGGGGSHDASAAARGLSSGKYAKKNGYNISAVAAMENAKIDDDLLNQFLREGGLGEYEGGSK